MRPRISFLETAYDQSKDKWRGDYYAAQAKRGGGVDPFAETLPPVITGAFECLPKSLVTEALTNVRARLPHGSIVIKLSRPTLDQQHDGIQDLLASDSPEWWVGAAQVAGIYVTHYTVNMVEATLVFNW